MTQDELKLVLETLKWCHGGEPCGTAEAIAVVEKALAQEEALQALHAENERLGLYKDAYQPKQKPVMQDSTCSITLRLQGKPYPRTCKKCGLGPCIAQPTAQPEQEPVAWARYPRYTGKAQLPEIVFKKPDGKDWLELYAHPPQRTWVGLEGEEIRNLWEEVTKPDRSTMTMVTSFARAIESKLKELNI